MDPEGATDSAMSFGLINALRTGNVLIDMCVCMLIPLVLKFAMLCVTGGLPKMWRMLLRLLEGKHKFEFIRNVEVLKRTSWSDLIGQHDTKNELLQKAIQMYIGTLELKYTTCDSRLKAIKDDNYYDDESGATHEQLKRYRIVRLPTEGEWCTVTPGVEFMHTLDINDKSDENGGGGGGGKSNTMRSLYCFRSYQEDGESLIDSFISKCFQYYKEEMEKHEATGRFMYTLAATPVKTTTDEDDGDDVGDGHNYRRYKLSEDKTFETWFNPSKDGLLALVNQFLEKKGKFGVKGFPHKLGLLLHGPPGTGKTSFIKCLAQYTKRNIVSIPLARIQTNQELMDIMFDMRYKVVGEDLPVRLNFDEVVFVMEDIDCASDIVCTRQKQIRRSEEKGESYLLTREMTEEEDTVATATAVSAALGADDKEEGQKKKKNFLLPSVDKLNLSGLLNVLDGVVDMPGRILVMTTNHPERLDPALIRPGRVNKRLFLGYLTRDDTAKMIERYFAEAEGGGVLTPEQKEQLPDERLTPAEMEQLCAEAETLVDLLVLVQDLLAKQPPRHPQGNPVRFA